jgi:hypothetical protein
MNFPRRGILLCKGVNAALIIGSLLAIETGEVPLSRSELVVPPDMCAQGGFLTAR